MNIEHEGIVVSKVIDVSTVEGYNLQHKTMGQYKVYYSKNGKYGYKLNTGVKITDLGVMYIHNNIYSIDFEFEFERGRSSISKVVCKMHKGEVKYDVVINHSDPGVRITKNKKIIFGYDTSSIVSLVPGVVLDIEALNNRYVDDIYDYRSLPVTYLPLKKYNNILGTGHCMDTYKKLLDLLDKEKEIQTIINNSRAPAINDEPALIDEPKKHIDAVCAICKERQPTYIMKDCMHLCLCANCEVNVEQCPICRTVCDKAKIYY